MNCIGKPQGASKIPVLKNSYKQPYILTIDIGSSSVKAALYDADANRIQETEAQADRELENTSDGGAIRRPENLVADVEGIIDAVLGKAGDMASNIAAVGMDAMAATVLGLDANGDSLTPIYTYADTRSGAEVEELKRELDVQRVYQRTGCPQHTSYLPGRFRWLQRTSPDVFGRVHRWVDVGTFLYMRWFGRSDILMSYTMASWSGLLNRHSLEWDEDLLAHVSVPSSNLPPLADYSQGMTGLAQPFANRWPALSGVPFFLAVGDGAAANVGSGCVNQDRVALTIGTSGALRVLLNDVADIPQGLWGYRLGERTLLGGSFSDGGSVFAWANDTLRLDANADNLEKELQGMPPDGHGLTVLPFLSGERSPGWATDATGAILGIRMATRPIHIMQAALESVAYRFGIVWDMLSPYCSEDAQIIASGGAIKSSPYWMQLITDVLGRTIVVSGETEATSRGTAILSLHALGNWPTLDAITSEVGTSYSPNPKRALVYQRGREKQTNLYNLVIGHDV